MYLFAIVAPAMPKTPPIVSASILTGLQAFLNARGVDVRGLLARSDLTPEEIADSKNTLPLRTVAKLLEDAAAATQNHNLGIDLARAFPVGGTGVFGFLFVNSRTVGEAMRTIVQYRSLIRAPETAAYEEDADGACIWWYWPTEVDQFTQFGIFSMALLLLRLKHVTRPDWRPLKVEVQHGPPASLEQFERIAGPNITFYAPRNAVYVDTATLAQPVAGAKPLLREVLLDAGNLLLAQMPPPQADVVDATRFAIDLLMPERKLSLEDVAVHLNVPPRTLQARLAQRGTSFEEVATSARKARAEQLLKTSNLSLTEIALQLGFSELSAFSRASQRWFARTPSAQRQYLRQQRDET